MCLTELTYFARFGRPRLTRRLPRRRPEKAVVTALRERTRLHAECNDGGRVAQIFLHLDALRCRVPRREVRQSVRLLHLPVEYFAALLDAAGSAHYFSATWESRLQTASSVRVSHAVFLSQRRQQEERQHHDARARAVCRQEAVDRLDAVTLHNRVAQGAVVRLTRRRLLLAHVMEHEVHLQRRRGVARRWPPRQWMVARGGQVEGQRSRELLAGMMRVESHKKMSFTPGVLRHRSVRSRRSVRGRRSALRFSISRRSLARLASNCYYRIVPQLLAQVTHCHHSDERRSEQTRSEHRLLLLSSIRSDRTGQFSRSSRILTKVRDARPGEMPWQIRRTGSLPRFPATRCSHATRPAFRALPGRALLAPCADLPRAIRAAHALVALTGRPSRRAERHSAAAS